MSEGTATYLATLYAGYGEANTFGAWRRWIGGSDTLDPGTSHNFDETTSLTHRSYDAIGWYSLVAHVTNDPLWSKMAGAWLAYLQSGPTAYIAALGADSPRSRKRGRLRSSIPQAGVTTGRRSASMCRRASNRRN